MPLGLLGLFAATEKCLRQKIIFMSEINLVCPVQSFTQKYIPSDFQKRMFLSPHPVPVRGALRDRHGRWARDAMDVDCIFRRGMLAADGQGVWAQCRRFEVPAEIAASP
jgi:hypothetical protein